MDLNIPAGVVLMLIPQPIRCGVSYFSGITLRTTNNMLFLNLNCTLCPCPIGPFGAGLMRHRSYFGCRKSPNNPDLIGWPGRSPQWPVGAGLVRHKTHLLIRKSCDNPALIGWPGRSPLWPDCVGLGRHMNHLGYSRHLISTILFVRVRWRLIDNRWPGRTH